MSGTTKLSIPPQDKAQFGISITVYDEVPDRLVFTVMGDWQQPYIPGEANIAVLTEVSNYVFKKYERLVLDNQNLLNIQEEVDRYMREHHSALYTGHVRLRRVGHVNGELRQRYIGRKET